MAGILENEDAIGWKARMAERLARSDDMGTRLHRRSESPHMSQPLIRAAVTRARIERVIARLPEVSEERLDGIEATLFEIGELRATCSGCGLLYRPYLERCGGCGRA